MLNFTDVRINITQKIIERDRSASNFNLFNWKNLTKRIKNNQIVIVNNVAAQNIRIKICCTKGAGQK